MTIPRADVHNGNNAGKKKKEYIIWCDVKTTGVVVFDDKLLEIGALVTDMEGNKVGEGFTQVVQVAYMKTTVDKCDDYVQNMHTKNGLFEDLWYGGLPLDEIEDLFIEWLKETVPEYDGNFDKNLVFYFGGRSITLNRNFLYANTPRIFNVFSHQSVDLTSISLMLERNFPQVDKFVFYVEETAHRALQDSEDCVEQYKAIIKTFNNNLVPVQWQKSLVRKDLHLQADVNNCKLQICKCRYVFKPVDTLYTFLFLTHLTCEY